jgi:hypothetical protein
VYEGTEHNLLGPVADVREQSKEHSGCITGNNYLITSTIITVARIFIMELHIGMFTSTDIIITSNVLVLPTGNAGHS